MVVNDLELDNYLVVKGSWRCKNDKHKCDLYTFWWSVTLYWYIVCYLYAFWCVILYWKKKRIGILAVFINMGQN